MNITFKQYSVKRYILFGIIFSLFSISLIAQTKAPAPFVPVPNENQSRWQEMEYYAFVHFSLNTYTDQSWGFGNEDVKLFNPEKADCRQWARICKEAGMKGIIITAKHHCGFCLWPSKYTEYSVKNSPWKNGKGDMVREMADACKEYGLKLGIYLSPWDRNNKDYGKPEYITYFRNQLTELLTNYGEIFEVWFDGANGGDGYYGGANEVRKIDRTTYYDWKNTYAMIRKLQPNIVIWNDGGDRGDLRWVGTEDGYVGETNWSLLNATGDVPWNDDNLTKASLTIDLGKPTLFNRFMAQEYIRLGQRVKTFMVEALVDGNWKELEKATTIGYKRILRFPSIKATKVRFNITDSKSCPVISNIGIYNAPVFLNAPSIARNQSGEITITTNDIGPIFYYTLNGSEPTIQSNKYAGSFQADGKVEVKAIAYDPASGKSSAVGHEKFDISKKDWKIVGINNENANKILDGNTSTVWHQRDGKKMPIDLVIDLGKKYNVSGFKYLPDQNRWNSGIITNYQFYVSDDNIEWKLINEGEFSNIKNNPVWQIKNFSPVNARYIKLKAIKNTSNDNVAGYAEVDVITN